MQQLFRRRGSDLALPTSSAPTSSSLTFDQSSTTAHSHPRRSSIPWNRSKVVDGSARSIRLHDKSVLQLWKEAQAATRITYILTATFLFITFFGIRSIRHQYAHISVHCHLRDCTISVRPLHLQRKVTLTVPRPQLVAALAVKTTSNGTYVSSHPPLHEPYQPPSHSRDTKGSKKTKPIISPSAGISYKGPDEHGHYVSYALILQENKHNPELLDLTPLHQYLQPLQNEEEEDGNNHERQQWYLTFHLFGIAQTKRRVRTMLTRLEGYVQKRRQTATIQESTTPSVVGILCVVLGLLGALLTVLFGQYVNEPPPLPAAGPGARRTTNAAQQQQQQRHSHTTGASRPHHHQQQPKSRAASLTTPYQRATPLRYEVKMQPATVNVQKQY